MTKVLVLSFKEEKNAIAAFHKLNELESSGTITTYEKTLVRKKDNGDYEILKEDNSEGWRTITGMAIGGLLGILGGPVGLIIGLYAGTTIGAFSELNHYDIAEDFVSSVESSMPAGAVSIIAEADDDSSDLIVTEMLHMGAVTTRSSIDFQHDSKLVKQIREINQHIAEAGAALQSTDGEQKDTVRKQITELKEKRRSAIALFEANSKKPDTAAVK